MGNALKIKMIDDNEINFFMSNALATELNLLKTFNANLCFGCTKQNVNIKICEELTNDTIKISKKVMQALYLPEYLEYEIAVKDNNVILGPFIGLLFSSVSRRYTSARLNKILSYFKRYNEIHGAIVIFALNKVNKEKQLIEGYCYNPAINGYQKGIFPYPAAIYRKIGLEADWRQHLTAVIGDKIFNSHYFNKWDMYKWFENNSEINNCLPKTILYKTSNDLEKALDIFENVYIKPVAGLRGHKIYKVSRQNGKIILKYRIEDDNFTDEFKTIKEFKDEFRSRIKSRHYLIQQAVELIKYRGGVIDFRCIMQKDQANKWNCMSVIGRCGGRDSIVSNISSGGSASRGVDIFERAIQMPESQRIILKEKIITLAKKACMALDEQGINCGSLGLDIGVDTSFKLWLFEMNNRDPDPTISMNIHDMQLYYDIKAGILLYAKYLAGFGSEEK